MRARLAIALAAAALSLASCAGGGVQSAGDVAAQATTRLGQVEEAFAGAKAFAELLLPFATPEQVARVHALEDKISAALFVAHTAASIAEQSFAIDQAEKATAELAAPG